MAEFIFNNQISNKQFSYPIYEAPGWKLEWRRFALKDVRNLVDDSVLKGSFTRQREKMAKMANLLKPCCVVLEQTKDAKKQLLFLVEFYGNRYNKSFCSMYINYSSGVAELSKLKLVFAQLEDLILQNAYWQVNYYIDDSVLKNASQALADKALSEKRYINNRIKECLESNNFLCSASVEDYISEQGLPKSASRYTWCLDSSAYECRFIRFAHGYLVLKGYRSLVYEIGFRSPGEEIQDEKELYFAFKEGITSTDKKYKLLKNFKSRRVSHFSNIDLAEKEIKAYLQGEKINFSFKYIYLQASEFQLQVWDKLRSIDYASTVSYLELARRISKNEKKARNLCRAVGSACGANPLPILNPCHRVIGNDNTLTGFSGGIEFKAALLDLELENLV